jgi:DNA-binding ferritin-like protein (Dps family)
VLSQINNMQENFEFLQNDFKKSNKKDIVEFKEKVSELTEIVGNLVENELPKYKKQITKNEVRIGDKFEELKEVVEENIISIKEEIDIKVNDIVEVIGNNLEYFNNQLQETSVEVKKTTDTYNKLSKIVESKVSKENDKLEQYSQVIKSLHEAFVELEESLQKETSTYNQIIEEKFETISSGVKNIIGNIGEDVDTFKNQVSSDILSIKADVVINEQHIKNVDKYIQEHHQELVELKEEVFGEIEKLPVGNLQENLERLEKKIDYIKETYSKIEPEVIVKEVIKEGLLNEPPEVKNSDPLTPLNQNFVTVDELNDHYKLFINRIQQQMATIGGGGETQFKYLDDIVNFIFVGSINDLPVAVNGVITLKDNYTYFFTKTVDLLGSRLVAGENTTILGGSSENCRIKSTGIATDVALLSSVADDHCALRFKPGVALTVTPVSPTTSTAPAPVLRITICVPTAKATLANVGTNTVPTLDISTTLPLSVKSKV